MVLLLNTPIFNTAAILPQYYLNTTQILHQHSILSCNTTAILPQYNIVAISIPQTPISILHVFQYNSILPIQLNFTHRLNTTSSQYYPILPILPILPGATCKWDRVIIWLGQLWTIVLTVARDVTAALVPRVVVGMEGSISDLVG